MRQKKNYNVLSLSLSPSRRFQLFFDGLKVKIDQLLGIDWEENSQSFSRRFEPFFLLFFYFYSLWWKIGMNANALRWRRETNEYSIEWKRNQRIRIELKWILWFWKIRFRFLFYFFLSHFSSASLGFICIPFRQCRCVGGKWIYRFEILIFFVLLFTRREWSLKLKCSSNSRTFWTIISP